MEESLFSTWTDLLIEQAFDWREIGISNDFCNNISIPNFGLKIHSWPDHIFEVVDEKKYMMFLLRHR